MPLREKLLNLEETATNRGTQHRVKSLIVIWMRIRSYLPGIATSRDCSPLTIDLQVLIDGWAMIKWLYRQHSCNRRVHQTSPMNKRSIWNI